MQAPALTAMVGALAPGGVLAVEDVEMSAHFCYPDCPAFRRYVELYVRAATARGDDPDIGPRLPSLLHEAGLREVDMSVVQPAGLRGDVKLMNPITMENISDAVVSAGLASAAEVADIIRQLCAEALRRAHPSSASRVSFRSGVERPEALWLAASESLVARWP